MKNELITWLRTCDEPWTRYRTMLDLMDLDVQDAPVKAVRKEMIEHPQIQALLASAAS